MIQAKYSTAAMAMLVGLTVWLIYPRVETQAQSDVPSGLIHNVPVQGTLADRFGEEWTLAGCAGDVITATIQSAAFAPNLELYPPVGRTPLAATRNTSQRSAQLPGTTLPANGEYTLVALGSSARDRGAYSLTLVSSDTTAQPEEVRLLTPGVAASGTVSTRDGEEWGFRGCAHDTITLTMQSTGAAQSTAFPPMLEFYGPTGRTPLTTSSTASANNRSASITAFALPQTGNYTVLAAGQSIRDRGPYTLTLIVTTGSVTTATATPTVPPKPLCTVVTTGGLRVRSGPGTVYPVIGSFPKNAQLRPRGRDAGGAWIDAELVGAAQRGWVSAGAQFVTCNVAVRTLPLGLIPPTPAFTPTRLPPTATPVPVAAEPGLPQPEGALVQGPGGNPGNLAGDIYTAPGTLAGYRDGDPVFRDPFFFELFVFDPAKGAGSGAGIDHVTFTIDCPNGESYSRTERNARYCAFGGGEPNCNVVRLKPGAFLPDSQCSIEDGGSYSASITAVPRDERRRGGNWNFNFILDLSGR